MKKVSMAVRRSGSLVVLRENNETPTDDEWDVLLDLLTETREHFEAMKFLVLTDGGGPNSDQRKRLERALGGKSVRVAIVSDSPKARFIASAITFLNKHHRGFSTKEIDQAYVHLAMTSAEQRLAQELLLEMNKLMR